jgi:hypothetical protein
MADPKAPPAISGKATNSSGLANSFGVDMSGYVPPESTKKKIKTGIYKSVQISSQAPNDQAIRQTINKVFKAYYGRDARADEIATWAPQLKAKFTSKNGKSKTNITYTYDNSGNLISTEYLTADGLDPALWLDEQVKANVAKGIVEINKAGIPEGPSGQYFIAIKNLARNNGINLSDTAAADYANKINAGIIDENTVMNTLRESAASAFPQFADKIKAGIDLKTLADPYIQSMSRILELPDSAIDVFDPKVRGALSFTMPDGKVGTKSIYDFEKELRQDTRWQYTNNAREEVSNSVVKVLKDFGFMG